MKKQALKIAAAATAMVVGLSLFAACDEILDDSDAESDEESKEGTYGASYSGTIVFDTVVVTEENGIITALTATAGSTSYEGVATDDDAVWTVTVGDTVYTITVLRNADSGYTYSYTADSTTTYTASYSGEDTNALSGYSFAVTYQADSEGNTTISKVVASDSDGEETQLSGTDGVYTLSTSGEGGYEEVYTITFKVSDGSVSYTYTVATVEDAEATGGLSGTYGVHVKYTSSSGGYTVVALGVDDGENPVVLTANSGGTYTYAVDSDGLYTSEEDSIATTYTITLDTTNAPTYTYTYARTTTADYTATGEISGVAISVNATVSETYNGSSSTYKVASINGVSAASSSDSNTTYEVTANTSGTYSFTVEDDSTTTTYTITLTESTSGGVSYTYSYEASEYFGSSDTDFAGFVTLLSALSDGCTIVLSPYLSSEQLEWFADALSETSLSGVTLDMSYMTITAVSEKLFYNNGDKCTNITSVILPSCVTTIEPYAFYNCTNITSVTIAEGTTAIRDYAFYDCASLTNVTIPDSVTSIRSYAFSGCTKLTSVTIGSGVTTIGNYAFQGCTALTEVTIPDSVKSLGPHAFYVCRALKTVTIGNGVEAILNSAFHGCTALAEVTIPDSVTSIGGSAFGSCSSLTEITIPDSVTSLGECVFDYCTALETAVIGDGVEIIPRATFSGCAALKTVTIGSSVTTISLGGATATGEYYGAFANCSSLATVYYNGTTDEWGEISIEGTDYEAGNYYLTQATIICTDGTYTY